MEFSEDFSVLQGAFRRAEQQALPKTLAEIVNKKDCSCKQYATVITEAVNDIIAGLSTHNNSVQKEFSRFKIHAAFFVKWMDRPSSISEKSDDVVKNSHETGIGNLSVFDTIHRSLPAFDTPVYVSLLKTCGMGKYCSECLLQLPVKTQNVYLAELITCMTTDLNDGDVQLWIDMLQSALTWSQGHMETYGESGHQVITTLLKSFDKMKNTVCERETKRRIIKLFSDCLCCMMTDWPTSRGQSHEGQKTSARSLSENEVIQHCRRLDNLLTRNVNLESSSQIVSLTHGLEKISPYMSHSKNVTNLNFGVRLEVIATVIPLLRDVLCNVWPELLMDSEDKCKDDTREKQSVTRFSETLCTLYDTLEMLSVSDVFREDSLTEGSENIPSLRNYTEELCEKLKNISLAPSDSAPISAELPETHTQIGKVTDTSISEDVFEVKFKEAVWRVNERLKGYQECMEWLLSSGCRQLWFCDKRWIECIGTNLPGMSSAQLTIQLITILHEVMSSPTSEINQKELLFKLREVTLQCFRTLPIMLQNRIRDHIVDTYGLPTIFEQSLPASYHQHLTTVFNQLVNVDKKSDFQELLAEISSLCFQSPCETLSKAISVAISSSAQVHLIIQILQCMASSCKHKITSDKTILCQELYQAGITSSESASQKNNFLELVRLLLQPFQSPLDQTSPLTHPPLLDVQELVKTCVLPYLSLNYKQTDYTLPTSTALLLFKVALETAGSLDESRWLIDLSPYPIMLCMCSLLEECNVLWDTFYGYHGSKLEIKELTVDLLHQISEIMKIGLAKGLVDRNGLIWLQNRLEGMDWLVCLHLREFLQDTNCDHKQNVPAELYDICDLSSSHWQPFNADNHATGEDVTSGGFLAFVQGCKVSKQISDVFLKHLKRGNLAPPEELYKEFLVALVQVLPQCTRTEWNTIVSVLQELMHDGTLRVPYSTRFMKQLPFHEFQGSYISLCTSQILTSVLEVLSDSSCGEWTSLSLWRHVTKMYAGTIKDLAENKFSTSYTSRFALTQIFCHSCQAMSVIPQDATEHVFVLSLELLGMIEESTSANGQTHVRELTNQRTAMISAIHIVPISEQRATLNQKLISCAQLVN